MFKWFVLLSLLLGSRTLAGNEDVGHYRQLLLGEPTKTDLVHALSSANTSSLVAVQQAYLGCFTARLADFSYNPYTKWRSFTDGRELIEKAVVLEPDNAEVRFVRLCVQTKAPSFLNYHSQVEEDTNIVLIALQRGWLNTEHEFRSKVAQFMLLYAKLTTEQRQMVRQFVLQ